MKMKLVIVMLFALLFSACSFGNQEDAADTTTTTAVQPLSYVAIGASESAGVGSDDPETQAWPVVLHRTAMPADTTILNLGVSGSTLAQAMTAQLPKAVEANPDIVTIWLNVNDLITGVSPQAYEKNLLDMVQQLKDAGATQVLIANMPPVQELPIFETLKKAQAAGSPLGEFPVPSADAIGAQVDAYNSAIQNVVVETHSTLVDLNAAFAAERTNGDAESLISSDGFHPSIKGHEFVAKQFANALDLPN